MLHSVFQRTENHKLKSLQGMKSCRYFPVKNYHLIFQPMQSSPIANISPEQKNNNMDAFLNQRQIQIITIETGQCITRFRVRQLFKIKSRFHASTPTLIATILTVAAARRRFSIISTKNRGSLRIFLFILLSILNMIPSNSDSSLIVELSDDKRISVFGLHLRDLDAAVKATVEP